MLIPVRFFSLRLFLVAAVSLLFPISATASQIDIYATADYDADQVTVQIMADITDVALDKSDALVSAGVKLRYNADELTIATPAQGETNPSKNENIWYFTDGTTTYSYLEPDTSVAGEIGFLVGRINTANPDDNGVEGEGVLIGRAVFDRASHDTPTDPAALFALSLSFNHEDEPQVHNVQFVDFADLAGNDLDATIQFASVNYSGPELCTGDATGDLIVNMDDLMFIRDHWLQSGSPFLPGDVTGDGLVNMDDLMYVRDNWLKDCN